MGIKIFEISLYFYFHICRMYSNALSFTSDIGNFCIPLFLGKSRFIDFFVVVVFVFLVFLGPLPWHMEFPRLGVESAL